MTDGIRTFYRTNDPQPELDGSGAEDRIPLNKWGGRICIGADAGGMGFGLSVHNVQERLSAFTALDREELIAIRDAITAELERSTN